jgi:hypothetical protein
MIRVGQALFSSTVENYGNWKGFSVEIDVRGRTFQTPRHNIIYGDTDLKGYL